MSNSDKPINLIQKAAERLYQNAGPQAGGPQGGGQGPAGGDGKADDIIDAEVVEEKK